MSDLILLSGGLDSAVVLAESVAAGRAELALGVNYGQRHVVELNRAAALARHYRVPLHTLDLTEWGRMLGHGSSSLVDKRVSLPLNGDPQASTVVPNRNAVLFSLAVGIAQGRGISTVVAGMNADDRDTFPDCRTHFVDGLAGVVAQATEAAVRIETPLLGSSKTDVAVRALRAGVPLDLTWSCYAGGDKPCQVCAACTGRAIALSRAGGAP